MVEVEEFGGLVCCEWCGRARGKKVRLTLDDQGTKIVVCRRHLEIPTSNGELASKPTVEAIIRHWSGRT